MDNPQNPPKPHSARLFFAVPFEESTQKELLTLIQALKKLPHSQNVRWEKPQNLHITLHFLGNLTHEKVPQLITNVQQAITDSVAFEANFTHVQVFPPSKHPTVLALGITPSASFQDLVTKIAEGMMHLNLSPEKRPYVPHLTIGRLKRPPHPFITETPKLSPFSVNRVILFQSFTLASGAEYQSLETFQLKR